MTTQDTNDKARMLSGRKACTKCFQGIGKVHAPLAIAGIESVIVVQNEAAPSNLGNDIQETIQVSLHTACMS